ncbi:MAG: nuclear transport factor 2 family protein [Pirellulaceae bacterium]
MTNYVTHSLLRPVRYLLIVLAFFSQPLRAQEDSTQSTAGLTQADIDEVTQVRDGLIKAVMEKDEDSVLAWLHAQVVLTTQDGLNLEVIRSHDGIRDYMQRTFTGKQPIIKSVRPNVQVDDVVAFGDSVVAYGSSNDHYVLSSGGEFDLASRWSATLVRDEATWKIANLHISSNVFNNPIFNAAKNSLYRVGGIALGLGLILGLFLAKLLGRGK